MSTRDQTSLDLPWPSRARSAQASRTSTSPWTASRNGGRRPFNISTNNVLTADQLHAFTSLNRFQEFGVFNGRDGVSPDALPARILQTAPSTSRRMTPSRTLAGKISLAMYSPDGTRDHHERDHQPAADPDLVHVNTVGMAKGTMSITTAVPGAEIVFAGGDESLLKALSLVEIQEGGELVYSINAFNIEEPGSRQRDRAFQRDQRPAARREAVL
ncbi:MAG: hypothetical protein R3F46_00255 [bacterium]